VTILVSAQCSGTSASQKVAHVDLLDNPPFSCTHRSYRLLEEISTQLHPDYLTTVYDSHS
jgi:hypothetical protein